MQPFSDNPDTPQAALSAVKPRRNVQHVINHTQRSVVVTWMLESSRLDGDKHLCARTVKHFPQFFRSNMKANIQRASRYWKRRETILAIYRNRSRKNGIAISRCTANSLKTYVFKAAPGRGKKRSPWVTLLYKTLQEEFDRYRKAGVRFAVKLLRALALRLIENGDNDLVGPGAVDPRSGNPIASHITARWIQNFMQNANIVVRSQCGKLLVSPAKRELIEREVAYHLGTLKRQVENGILKEDNITNADETHFVINLHNHKALARKGDEDVKLADVVSGDEGMTMMVLITGGRESSILPPMMIFKNDSSSYPIRGVQDDVPGVCYKTGRKGWMDSRVFGEWINENRAVPATHDRRKRFLYIDNCSGHSLTNNVRRAMRTKNIEIRFFPADLIQPADSHLIQKIKATWRARWNDKVIQLIESNAWVDPRSGSGKLANPSKHYFLQLAANCVKDVNQNRHKDGVLYSRRAMICCGLALNLNGQWEEKQLSKDLQAIIKKYRENFEGEPVTHNKDLEGEATETDNE